MMPSVIPTRSTRSLSKEDPTKGEPSPPPPPPITISVNESPSMSRESSFNENDPRASAYSHSSSSSSDSSDNQRMSMASTTSSIEVTDDIDDVVEDGDDFDDDVWVSRRFTMMLSPDAIKVFSTLPAFSRSTIHTPLPVSLRQPSQRDLLGAPTSQSFRMRSPSPTPPTKSVGLQKDNTMESIREARQAMAKQTSKERLNKPAPMTKETSKDRLKEAPKEAPKEGSLRDSKEQSPRESQTEQSPRDTKEISPRDTKELSPRDTKELSPRDINESPRDTEQPQQLSPKDAQKEDETKERCPSIEKQPSEEPTDAKEAQKDTKEDAQTKERPKNLTQQQAQENGHAQGAAAHKVRSATLRPSVSPRVNPPSTRLSQIPSNTPITFTSPSSSPSPSPASPPPAATSSPSTPTPSAVASPPTPSNPSGATSPREGTNSASTVRPGSAIVSRPHANTLASPRASLPTSPQSNHTASFTTPSVSASSTASVTPNSKSKPPTAPRSTSNRHISSPIAPSTPTSPTSAAPTSPTSPPTSPSSVASPTSPSSATPISNTEAEFSDFQKRHASAKIPTSQSVVPRFKIAKKASYTKEEQAMAARVIQNYYRLHRGKRIHQQQVAIYRLRTHIANEIVNTEKTYVAVLRHVVTRYYEPLSRDFTSIGIENEDVKVIFGSLPVLLNVNSNLLKSLENRMEKWSSTQCLGDLFLNMAAYLKSYTEYVKNFDLALRKIVKCSKNPQFVEFLQSAEDNDEKRVTLESYLITPVQRIPRYVLLLQQMHEHTPPSHVDYSSLTKALTQMRDVALYINEKKREADNALRVVEIQSLLTGKGVPNLINAQRRFCHEGDIYLHLNKKGGKIKKKRFLFLFNDILVLTKPTIVQTIFTKKKKYRYKFYISLSTAELTESTTPESTFTITTNGYSWMFSVDTDEAKTQWVNAMKQCIETLRSSSVKFEERVSKISKQKAGAARAAITKQYTSMRVKETKEAERRPSAVNLQAQMNTPSTPSQTAASPKANCAPPDMSNVRNIPYLELDDKEMADIENIEQNTPSQRRVLTDVLSRWLRTSSSKVKEEKHHPPQEKEKEKEKTKKSKSIIDIMTLKSILMAELLDKVTTTK